MPLLDIASSQPSFQNHLGASRTQALRCSILGGSTFAKEKRLTSYTWKVTTQIPKKACVNAGQIQMQHAILVKAVATTLEPKYLLQNEDGLKDEHNWQPDPESNTNLYQSTSEEPIEIDERERLRRMRISKANKGNVPWNKGRKHSAETLRRIRERTKLAMQDPKVKMKLINLGHAQSEETKIKIGVGVRIGWQRRREKLMLQENCYFDWQNLIAEASRRGYAGEEELQWDSYEILDEQLEHEWRESIEQRKLMSRPKGSKRAPKSLEQRKKISEAISAKWTDPGYRERVCSALAKYHGTPVGGEKKQKKRPSGETQTRRSTPVKKKAWETYNGNTSEAKGQRRPRRKSSTPSYKDPLANSKLEMIKNIREQRAAMVTKKKEAMERAKLLIGEAERAAQALEVAATWSPLARTSLIETRRLIAEATRSIEAVETGQVPSHESKNSSHSSFESNGVVNHFKGKDTGNGVMISPIEREVNGTHDPVLGKDNDKDFYFSEFALQNLLNGEEVKTSSKPAPRTKKWFRGRLVEICEGDQQKDELIL